MRKLILIFLTISILAFATGCQNEQDLHDTSESQTEDSETMHNTQINTESDSPISVEIPTYAVEELTFEIIPDKDMHTLDLVVFDTNVYAIVKIVGNNTDISEKENPYYLISFDFNGENITYISLETPKLDDNPCFLKQFTIGQDGNVYALKTNYADTSSSEHEPKYDDRVQLVCWNTNGKILYEKKLELLDKELYSDVHIRNLTVSKDGNIALCCKHRNGGHFILNTDANGTVKEIIEDTLSLYTATYFWKNNDGSLASIRSESEDGESQKNYYICYDVNTQAFHEEILGSNELDVISSLSSVNNEYILYYSENGIYQYDMINEKSELRINTDIFHDSINVVTYITPLNETDYICIYQNNTLDAIHRIAILHQIEE